MVWCLSTKQFFLRSDLFASITEVSVALNNMWNNETRCEMMGNCPDIHQKLVWKSMKNCHDGRSPPGVLKNSRFNMGSFMFFVFELFCKFLFIFSLRDRRIPPSQDVSHFAHYIPLRTVNRAKFRSAAPLWYLEQPNKFRQSAITRLMMKIVLTYKLANSSRKIWQENNIWKKSAVDMRTILKWTLKKLDVNVWSVFTWLMIQSRGHLL
jgi:hypothetical protein